MAGVLSTGLLALAAVANALPQASPSGSSCLQLGNSTQVGAYTITCGTDRVGGDLSNAQSSSFSGCIPLCDALSECIGFTYVTSTQFCYFKSSLAATSSDANVDVAVKPAPSSSSSSATVSATTTGTATSTSAASTSTASGSCAAIGSGNAVGGYTATCSTDAYGGDLSNAQATSFAACAPLCDQLTGCIGFAYANGFCYFKSSQNAFTSSSGVDVAFKPTPSSTSAVSTTAVQSTTAPTTTAPTTSASSMASSSSTSVLSSSVPTTLVSRTSIASSTTPSSTSAASTAAPAPTGSIINPINPNDSQCTLLRRAPQFRLSVTVQRGNRALNGLFLQSPTFGSLTSPPLLVSGSANAGRFVQTNSNNWLNFLPSITSVSTSGTCTTAGLALYTSNTEQGAVGLVPGTATASTVDILTTTNYVFPFQLYTFGSFYACAGPTGATLRWVKNDASNLFGSFYRTLDLTNCALVTLQKVSV